MDNTDQMVQDCLQERVKELQEAFPGQYVTLRAECLGFTRAPAQFQFVAYTEKLRHSGPHETAAAAVWELIARKEAA